MIGAWTHRLVRYETRTRIRAEATGSVAGPKLPEWVRVLRISESVVERNLVSRAPGDSEEASPGDLCRLHTGTMEIKFLFARE